MAKNKQGNKAAAAPAKSVGKAINRKRRNAAERKSLPKALKYLFSRPGADGQSWYKVIDPIWRASRDKTKSSLAISF